MKKVSKITLILALALVFVLALTAFVACNKDKQKTDDNGGGGGGGANNPPAAKYTDVMPESELNAYLGYAYTLGNTADTRVELRVYDIESPETISGAKFVVILTVERSNNHFLDNHYETQLSVTYFDTAENATAAKNQADPEEVENIVIKGNKAISVQSGAQDAYDTVMASTIPANLTNSKRIAFIKEGVQEGYARGNMYISLSIQKSFSACTDPESFAYQDRSDDESYYQDISAGGNCYTEMMYEKNDGEVTSSDVEEMNQLIGVYYADDSYIDITSESGYMFLRYTDLPGFRFEVLEDNTASVEGYFYNTDAGLNAVIPSTDGNGHNVSTIGNYAFGHADITSVQIPASVTLIDTQAFSYCEKLASVTLPAGLKRIGGYAFYACSSLKTVTIPAGADVGTQAFTLCAGLESVVIEEGVTQLGDQAFQNCSNLKSVTLPSTIEYLGSAAFLHCAADIVVKYNGDSAQFLAFEYGDSYDPSTGGYNIEGPLSVQCNDTLLTFPQ